MQAPRTLSIIYCYQEGITFLRATRAAAFIVVHIVLALIIIAGLYVIQLGLIAIGDPKLFDWMPVRYIFDAIDVGVLVAFFLFGGMEAFLLFVEHYKGVTVIRGGIVVNPGEET